MPREIIEVGDFVSFDHVIEKRPLDPKVSPASWKYREVDTEVPMEGVAQVLRFSADGYLVVEVRDKKFMVPADHARIHAKQDRLF